MQGSKGFRTGVDTINQVGTTANVPVQDAHMSDFGSMEINNSAITRVGNEQLGSYWDWDDDDRGIEMDIQALLSEFGDFGDFFENEVLPFGEVFRYLKFLTAHTKYNPFGDILSSLKTHSWDVGL